MQIYMLLLLLTLKGHTMEKTRVSASGGGIVKPGDDLTLTFNTGEEWERCFWFHYENEEHSQESHCSFDLVKDSGNVTLHSCKPQEMSEVMIPTGNNCEITISGVDDTNEGVWAARLDTDREAEEVTVVVAKEMEGLSLEMNLVQGKEGNISCTAKGGKPPPVIDIQFAEDENEDIKKLVNSEDNSNGVLLFTPSIEDHGKEVVCTARQLDGDKEIVFTKSVNGSVDVAFPPHPQTQGITIPAKLSSKAVIPISVMANPPPGSANWMVDFCHGDQAAEKTGERDGEAGQSSKNENTKDEERDEKKSTQCKKSFPPIKTIGYQDKKYTISNISTDSDPLFSKMEFEIGNIEEKDYTGMYSVTFQNSIGSEKYTFKLTRPTTKNDSSNSSMDEIDNDNNNDITNTTSSDTENNATATEISTNDQNSTIDSTITVEDSSSSFVTVVAVLGSLAVLVLLLILVVLMLTVYKVRQGTLTVTPAPEDHGKEKTKENTKENNNKVDQMELVET